MEQRIYQGGGELFRFFVSDRDVTTFLDSFLDRVPDLKAAEFEEAGRRPLATLILSGSEPSFGDPPATYGTAALLREGDIYRITAAAPGVAADYGDVLAMVRKLVRDIWLGHKAADGYYYLHASAVDDGKNVFVFVGPKFAGKTTMMLDMVAQHGYSLLTNDGLLVYRAGQELELAPLPTFAKIRPDVAERFLPFLSKAVAADAFASRMLDGWLAGSASSEIPDSLFMTFGALGEKFGRIRAADRHIMIVGVQFGSPAAGSRLRLLGPAEALALARCHQKSLVPSFPAVADFPRTPPSTENGLVRQLVGTADFAEFWHEGSARDLVDEPDDGAGSSYPSWAQIMAVLDDADDVRPRAELTELISALARQHEAQWRLEDACRLAGATDTDIASAKRQIDALNARRIEATERINACWAAGAPQPAAVPHTETLGQLLDRLVIAWVRVGMLAAASPVPQAKLVAARAQLSELGAAYEAVIADVACGTRRFPQWQALKRYVPPRPHDQRLGASRPA
jgi:Protein of unknown function (DUF4254)